MELIDIKKVLEREITNAILSHRGTDEELIQAYVEGIKYSLRIIDKALNGW